MTKEKMIDLTRSERTVVFASEMNASMNSEAIRLARLAYETINPVKEDFDVEFALGAVWGLATLISLHAKDFPNELQETIMTFHAMLCVQAIDTLEGRNDKEKS